MRNSILITALTVFTATMINGFYLANGSGARILIGDAMIVVVALVSYGIGLFHD
jgi:hypothetical protein